MIVSYIRKNFPEIRITYILHSKRQHGLTPEVMEQILASNSKLVIIPDASSNDAEQHTQLKEHGIDVIVLDHHDVEIISKDAIVVSNHDLISPEYINKEMTGAGITLKFLESLDNKYGIDDSKNYWDLAAVGIVADMSTILHGETRYYVYEGLANVKNPFIRQLIYKNAYQDLKKASPKTVSWSISNYINATIRAGTTEDKITVFRAMLGEKESLTRISKYRGKEREVTEELHETGYRLASNARNRQNTLKKKLVAQVKQKIEDDGLEDNAMILVTLDSFSEGYSGVIAGDIANTYRKPAVITSLDESGTAYSGSLRGYDAVLEDTRSFLEGTGLFTVMTGHPQAAGAALPVGNIDEINRVVNERLGNTSTQIEVDFEIDSKALNESLVQEFYQYNHLWCKGFEEPLVAVKNVELNCSLIEFKNTMKTVVNGVEVMAFQIDDRLQKLADEKKAAVVNIIGTLEINHYQGNKSPQMKIEALEILETKDVPNFGFVF
jgi:single-stranded-DNA-specific exonuclease